MKLQTRQLKQFNSVASNISQNGIIPILSYLKFDNGFITKNSLHSFVTMEADFKGQCLIDEKVLTSFVETTNADELEVVVDKKRVVIYNSKNKKQNTSCPTEPFDDFPANDEADGEEIMLDADVLSKIKIASNFTMEEDNVPYAKCVYVGNGLVAAATGYIGYTEKISDKIPNIILARKTISTLNNFEYVMFSENKTYQFFSALIFKFGFIKDDTKFVNMQPFSVVPEGEKKEVDKSEIIRFCERCVRSSPSKIVIANIHENQLSMIDSQYEVECEDSISTSLDDFCFNPSQMLKLLKSLPDQKVEFLKHTNKFFVTGKSGFVSLIMQIDSYKN